MRVSSGWRQVLAAWGLVLLLIFLGVGSVKLAPLIGLTEPSPELRGAKIPRYDPFDLGPPAYGEVNPENGEAGLQ